MDPCWIELILTEREYQQWQLHNVPPINSPDQNPHFPPVMSTTHQITVHLDPFGTPKTWTHCSLRVHHQHFDSIRKGQAILMRWRKQKSDGHEQKPLDFTLYHKMLEMSPAYNESVWPIKNNYCRLAECLDFFTCQPAVTLLEGTFHRDNGFLSSITSRVHAQLS